MFATLRPCIAAIGAATLLLSLPCAAAALPPLGGDAQRYAITHVQAHARDARERAPAPAADVSLELTRSDYDRPRDIAARLRQARSHTRAAIQPVAASCDTAAFAGASGAALVAAVKASDLACLNQLYSVSGAAAAQTFAEPKMIAIANAMQADAPAYPGDDSAGMLELITFLRAGYYVQYYDAGDVGAYGAALAAAIRPALDAFTASAHFQDVNDAHGQVLSEFVTLIDSAAENAHQMGTLKALLGRYGAGYHDFYYMVSAVNNVFNVLFRGHQNADFVALVQSDSSITAALASFIADNAADAGGDDEYLLANAGRELARFLQYAALLGVVEPKVKNVLDAYPLVGSGASIYVATADGAYTYDAAHCAYFGLCSFPRDLEQAILVVDHQCSPTLRLRAQSLTAQQVIDTCAIVAQEEGYFHRKLATGRQPVADDNNSMLEMVVFASSSDYQTYSGVIFGNDTNNGGIYLEGDPAAAGNQPRFLCYVAEWLTPFQIWNLTHEYIHYNDGRFDMYGSFGDYPLDLPGSAVWYIEGLAEYLSYSFREFRYADAIDAAGTRQFALSTVFDNTYDSGQARVYNWGYLATRFMFENHRDQIASMLGDFRRGDYAAYRALLAGMRSSHDAEWDAWLGCIGSHDGDTTTCGGSGNSEAGIFRDSFDGSELPPPQECSGADAQQLGDNCTRSNIAASGNPAYFTLLLPAGLAGVEIRTSGGSGNADLYAQLGSWPSTTQFDASSVQPGNDEALTITSPAAGWCYIMLTPTQAYSGVQVLARFQH